MIQPCSIYTGWTNGVAVNLEYMRKRPREALQATRERLTELPTITRARDETVAKDYAKHPTVPLSELTGDRTTTLIQALESLLAHPAADGNA